MEGYAYAERRLLDAGILEGGVANRHIELGSRPLRPVAPLKSRSPAVSSLARLDSSGVFASNQL